MLQNYKQFVKELIHLPSLMSTCLGFSSGLSVLLLMTTIPLWLHDYHVNKSIIGLFYLSYFPYVLKFLWAPFFEILQLPILSSILERRHSWAIFLQFILIISMIILANLDPSQSLITTAIVVLLISMASASRDIIIDGLRVDILGKKYNAAGTVMYLLGFRIGMLISGSLGLILADYLSWSHVYIILTIFLIIGSIPLLFRTGPNDYHLNFKSSHGVSNIDNFIFLLKKATLEPAYEFFNRSHWLLVLTLIPIFKISDNYIQSMSNLFFLDLGFTKSEIAIIAKLLGLIISIIGSLIGGIIVTKLKSIKTMFYYGIVHLIANLSFILLALLGKNYIMFIILTIITNLTSGIMTTGFVVFLSELCNQKYTQTQYSLFSSLRSLDKCLAFPSGLLVNTLFLWNLNWQYYFCISSLLALPGLYLCFRLMSDKYNLISTHSQYQINNEHLRRG